MIQLTPYPNTSPDFSYSIPPNYKNFLITTSSYLPIYALIESTFYPAEEAVMNPLMQVGSEKGCSRGRSSGGSLPLPLFPPFLLQFVPLPFPIRLDPNKKKAKEEVEKKK
jgi:hypothetical protein